MPGAPSRPSRRSSLTVKEPTKKEAVKKVPPTKKKPIKKPTTKKTGATLGRPTKYDPKYCDQMIKYFNVPHTIFREVEVIDKQGNIQFKKQEVANSFPTIEGFATKIKVHRDTLYEWVEKHKAFSDTYKKAKDYQKHMLINLGIRGLYNPTFTIFTAKNITDMKDRTEVDNNVTVTGELTDEERKAITAITNERRRKKGPSRK